MQKILIIAYDVNPTLGSEAGVASLWLKIISRYYQAFVITDSKHRKDIEKEDYGKVNFIYIALNDPLSRFFKKNRLYFAVYKIFINKAWPVLNSLIYNHDFKLVHCLTPASVYMYNDLYKLKLPVMIGPLGGGLKTPKGFESLFHTNCVRENVRNLLYSLAKRSYKRNSYLANSKKILIGTHYLLDYIPYDSRKNTSIFFDGIVDTSFFIPGPKSSSTKTHIAFIARLDPQKGPTLILEAMHKISQIRKDIRLTVAGTGRLFGEMKAFIQKHGLGDIVLLAGELNRQAVVSLLQNSDIFCLPTLREPGGVAILEAMSCGLPIITTDYGGPSFSVTGECGIKIKPTNISTYIDDLVRAILLLADDSQLRLKMGINARKRAVDHFSLAAFEQKVIFQYESIL